MPSNWKRSSEELHKTYIANTEAFYKVADRGIAGDMDGFMSRCACQLWSRSGAVNQNHVDAANQLYSKGNVMPKWLLWELTGQVCDGSEFMPPLFFWTLAERDKQRGSDYSRVFIRMFTNIMLSLAAVDDDVSMAEAEYISDSCAKLSAICDSCGVKKSKAAIDPADYVTSSEADFRTKNPVQAGTGSRGTAEKTAAAKEEVPAEKPSAEELMAQLDELVGLADIKKDVQSLVNLLKIRKLREAAGLPLPDMSLHLVFMGNPGTGKTTVARILAGLYAAIGVLSKGQLVEVDRSGLVAGFVGQTALKTREVIDSAIGGVLFIDEAYSLAKGGENDFGREAIDTILKAMEDHRDDLVVIVAGYDEPMDEFIGSNPGLESRFNKYFHFPDYTGEELNRIFLSMCAKNGYVPDDEALKHAEEFFAQLYENRDDNFGNAREVRNCFEDMMVNQADRLSRMEAPSKEELMKVTSEDLGV